MRLIDANYLGAGVKGYRSLISMTTMIGLTYPPNSTLKVFVLNKQGTKLQVVQEIKLDNHCSMTMISSTLIGIDDSSSFRLYRFDPWTNRVSYIRTDKLPYDVKELPSKGLLISEKIIDPVSKALQIFDCDGDGGTTKIVGQIVPEFSGSTYIVNLKDRVLDSSYSDVIAIKYDFPYSMHTELYSIVDPSCPKLLQHISQPVYPLQLIDGKIEYRCEDGIRYQWFRVQDNWIPKQLTPESSMVTDRCVWYDGIGYVSIEAKATKEFVRACNNFSQVVIFPKIDRVVFFRSPKGILQCDVWSTESKLYIGNQTTIISATLLKTFQFDETGKATLWHYHKISDHQLLVYINDTQQVIDQLIDCSALTMDHVSTGLNCSTLVVPSMRPVAFKDAIRIYCPLLIQVGLPRDLASLVCQYMGG